MENNDLIGKVYELRELILKSSEYTLVKEKEKEMENDEKFIVLSNTYKNIEEDYNKQIELGLENEELKQRLIKAKEELYSYALVRDYLESYHKINEMLKTISDGIEEIIK